MNIVSKSASRCSGWCHSSRIPGLWYAPAKKASAQPSTIITASEMKNRTLSVMGGSFFAELHPEIKDQQVHYSIKNVMMTDVEPATVFQVEP